MLLDLETWVAGGRLIELAGHKIFCRQDGPDDGPVVTLLHGYPTSSHDWAAIVPSLVESGHRVVTLDLLGFGASAKPRRHTYRIAEQADIVEALWSELNVSETALVAHDYSVSVAQELLHRAPISITAMAWLNGGVYVDLYRPLLIQRLLHGPLGGLLSRFTSQRAFMFNMRRILGREVDEADLQAMWAGMNANDGKAVQHDLLRYIDERAANATRWEQALEEYSGPTAFIWGPADPVSGGHVLERLRERNPDAQFTILDTVPVVGHYPHVEDPEGVAFALARLFEHDQQPGLAT
ncbi:MAG: alpha/beta fold hydrolase [Marmoricola sp.]